jgi:hypothetical protein
LVALQHLAGGGGGEVLGDEDVLVRDGHAGQLAALAFGNQGVGRLGLGQGGVFIDGDKSAQVLVLLGAGQEMLGGFGGGDLLGAQLRGQLGHAQLVEFGLAHVLVVPRVYSMTLGTRK